VVVGIARQRYKSRAGLGCHARREVTMDQETILGRTRRQTVQ